MPNWTNGIASAALILATCHPVAFAGVPDLSQLPQSSRQQPDFDAYEALGVRSAPAGFTYSDPASGVPITKISSSTIPVTNSGVVHGYSEGGPFVSREWGDGKHTILAHVDGQPWLVDYQRGVGISNWRSFPTSVRPFGDVNSSFASALGSEQILYFVYIDKLYRFNTDTMAFEGDTYIPSTGLEIPNTVGGLQWLQTSKDDEWIVMQSLPVELVTAFNRLDGTMLQREFPDLNEPHIDRGGRYVQIIDMGGSDPNCSGSGENYWHLWDLKNDTVECKGPTYGGHAGWVQGYFSNGNPDVASHALFYYDSSADLTIPTGIQYADDDAFIVSHRAGQWLQNTDGTDQWTWGSNYADGRVRLDRDPNDIRVVIGSWYLHSGDIYRTSELWWNPLYQKKSIGIRAVYETDAIDSNALAHTLTQVTSVAQMAPGTFYFDESAEEIYVWRHDGGDPTGYVEMFAPTGLHRAIGAQRIDGSETRFLAHHYSRVDPLRPDFYWDHPFATVSPDGKLVLFTSNMGAYTGRRDIFIAEVPLGDSGGEPGGPGGEVPVTWTNVQNAIADGNSLFEDCACGDSGAQSAEQIESGNGYIEFTAVDTHALYAIGLGHGNDHNGYDDIEFALAFWDHGWVEVRESGTYRIDVPYSSGDRFRIEIENGDVQFYKYVSGDLSLIYTSNSPSSLVYPLHVDTALQGAGTSVIDVTISSDSSASPPGNEVTWQNVVNAITDGNTITAEGTSGNSGAQSVETIGSGDGYTEFSVLETDTMRGAGLSFNEAGNGYVDIEFALVFWNHGWVEIRENGAYKGDIPYASEDRFRIAIEDGDVKYYKYVSGSLNLFHTTSSPSISYPVFVDTALHEENATIADVTLTDED